jgi:hypothetical protein
MGLISADGALFYAKRFGGRLLQPFEMNASQRPTG